MNNGTYYSDERLEIVILGPMRGTDDNSNSQIQQALQSLCDEPDIKAILERNGIVEIEINYPDQWQDNAIADGVFNRLDTADLVVVNITPELCGTDKKAFSPNVFYELGIVHSLGLPYILLIEEGNKAPFYVRNNRQARFSTYDTDTLKESLREQFLAFVSEDVAVDMISSSVSKFYEGLPIVDISAAVGVATGYYENFVRRVLKDGGFRSVYSDKIKHLIIVRPSDLMSTYEQEWDVILKDLESNGINLVEEKLSPIDTDKKGPLWIWHYNGIVVDLPRMAYPMKRSPRLLSLRRRTSGSISTERRNQLISRVSERLLDRVEAVIKYQMDNEMEDVNSRMLNYSSIDGLSEVILNM